MAWQDFVYLGKGRRSHGVGVMNGKIIAVSKSITESHRLSTFQWVTLRYDKDAKKIGLKFLAEREPGAAKFQSEQGTIAASVFIRSLGIPNGRFDATWDEC